MRRIRPILFWIHLSLGLAAGGLIFLMSVTGVMLGFERQTIAWLDGAPRIERPAGALDIPLDSALALAGVATADLASVIVRRDATAPVTLRFRDRERGTALLDPVRGSLLPPSEPGSARRFFSGLRRWHRWVGAGGGELRASMRAATGAANLAFLGLILSGIVLWWPRRWTPARLRATLVPSVRHSGHVRDFNWHNSLGFWSAIPLALVVASGVFISYQWPERLLDRVLGSPEEGAAVVVAARAAAGAPAPAPEPVIPVTPLDDVSVETLLDAAGGAHPAWQQLTLTLPAPTAASARVVVAEGNTLRPDLRTTLELARADGAVLSSSGYADLSTSRRIRSWVRFGHTGEVFGIPGQLIATLVTGVGAVLVWTGMALGLRRLATWRRRRQRTA
jgi:uncharacterized iron-regulated membrane protein